LICCGALRVANPFSSCRPAVMRTGPFFDVTTAASSSCGAFVLLLNLTQHLLRTFEDEFRHVERLERQIARHAVGDLEPSVLHAATNDNLVLRRLEP
jgi:hypothetical protein